GTEFGETEMYPDPEPITCDGTLIRVDIDPEQLVRLVRADVPIVADARLALAALARVLGAEPGRRVDPDGPGARRAVAIGAAVRPLWWPSVARHRRLLDA